MQIEIIADITCPWCFMGLKRLRGALEERPELTSNIIWRPFLLDMDIQDGVPDRTPYLSRMFVSELRIQRFYEAIDSAGLTTGIPFSPDVNFTPGSINAHRLIAMAAATDQHAVIAEEIFYAYFVEGRDIANVEVLTAIARKNGMDVNTVRDFLYSEKARDTVFKENARIHLLGLSGPRIDGVPSFIFDGRNIVSGAQEVQTLVRILDFAAKSSDVELRIPAMNTKMQSHGVGTP